MLQQRQDIRYIAKVRTLDTKSNALPKTFDSLLHFLRFKESLNNIRFVDCLSKSSSAYVKKLFIVWRMFVKVREYSEFQEKEIFLYHFLKNLILPITR